MRKIYLNNIDIDKLMEEIREKISNTKQDQITINLKNINDNRKKEIVNLSFTPTAWIKMTALVSTYSTEVQWHGLVERAGNSWLVTDILVFPHTCSGAMVVSDQEEYEEWLNDLSDDEFNKLKFHGHSHVNMGVTPSGKYGTIIDGNNDESYRARIVQGLPINNEPDNYYIFFIINKRYEMSARIYDISTNTIYDTDDGEINIGIKGIDLDEFLDDANDKTTRPTTFGYSTHALDFDSVGYMNLKGTQFMSK